MLNYNHFSEEESFRVLDFLNKASSVDDIMEPQTRFDASSVGHENQDHALRIGSLVAMRILDKRDQCPNKVFTKLDQLEGILGFGLEKLQHLVSSLNKSEAYIKDNTNKIPQHNLVRVGKGPITPSPKSQPAPIKSTEKIKLEDRDVSKLENVLRTYYLSQIKSLDGWKNRRQARELIEDHLVLPKSHQRTSKDGAFIKEKLGIEGFLLEQLEDTRLIRKISQRNANPIYEVSHDTLVEPILAEKRNKAMFWLFIEKWWGLLALVLLLFLIGGSILEREFHFMNNLLSKSEVITSDIGKFNLRKASQTFRDTIFFPIEVIEENAATDTVSLEIEFVVSSNPEPPCIDPPCNGSVFNPYPHFDLKRISKSINPKIFRGNPDPEIIDISDTVSIGMTDSENGLKEEFATVSGTVELWYTDDTTTNPPPLSSMEPIEIPLSSKNILANNSQVQFTDTVKITDYIPTNISEKTLKDILGERKIVILSEVKALPLPQDKYVPVDGLMMLDPNGNPIKFEQAPGTPKLYKKVENKNYRSGANEILRQSGDYHTVQTGETLYSIANTYGISVDELKRINNLKNDKLKLNQRLRKPN